MEYLLLPIGILLFHSLYTLSVKYLGQEPLWLKAYIIFFLIYMFLTPILTFQKIQVTFDLSNAFVLYGSFISLIVIFITIVNVMPKRTIRE